MEGNDKNHPPGLADELPEPPGKWACRLCERDGNTGQCCSWCGNPLSENANLLPLPDERPTRVRPYLNRLDHLDG
ncbi:hypothetical protein [Streptomonospora nanhaiensis]|uniref:Uncharacterized protein n=1 Tax=Streptomonospora nanhaiensis TaxID=1323731 RepID=A0A853BFD4_9ACTN|nr:hypothetical protein [Streptomonospora nanhaiensis]MBV2364414.1 hypothetical protein [Streptomonospora nanhaiensis]MBX9388442.1 hypothetical protein [Streptomonospora nanhaiensis]NYI94043.1 hypothetical protein [Streptomonospora nanhaiensis]